MQLPNKKYNIIYADPAWQYKDKSKNRGGAQNHYKTMTDESIYTLPVWDIADDNCFLFMWSTMPKLKEGILTVKAWGFNYKTVAFVWIKANKRVNINQSVFIHTGIDEFLGMGSWTRANAELCLLGVKGKPKRQSASVRQVIYSPIRKHSEKPPETRDKIIELCGDLSKIELFARQKTKGWDVWGNEV